jgi:hypothetical protein
MHSVDSQLNVSEEQAGSIISQRISHARLGTYFLLISCFAYSLTLMMQATCSSETQIYFQRTTRRYIPENRILQG